MIPKRKPIPQNHALYHITHRGNLRSIYRSGLLMEKATSIQRVWLCKKKLLEHIKKHLCKHHGWEMEHLIVFQVRIDDNLLHRFRDGIYHVYYNIPASHLELMKP